MGTAAGVSTAGFGVPGGRTLRSPNSPIPLGITWRHHLGLLGTEVNDHGDVFWKRYPGRRLDKNAHRTKAWKRERREHSVGETLEFDVCDNLTVGLADE